LYINIKHLHLLKFNNCKECSECCKNKFLAPLVLEDFEKVYQYFPILIAKLDTLKPVMLLSNEISCPYLKNETCSIYENRPPACRIYPFSPWYDSILLDISCKGVGIEGEALPLSKNEFINSKFFDTRIENIESKLIQTQKWLNNQNLKYFATFKEIELFTIQNINDKFAKMHKSSLKFLDNYNNLINKG